LAHAIHSEAAQRRRSRRAPWSVVLLAALGTVAGGTVVTLARPETVDAAVTPLVSTATSECGGHCAGTSLAPGDALSVTFNEPATVTPPWTLTLTDGANEVTLSSSDAGALTTSTAGGSTVAFTVGTFSGTPPSLVNLEILGSTGISANGAPWNLVASGQASKPYQVASCSEIATPTTYSRVFGGHNCSIGFGNAGPSTPDIFDEIALPTSDLVGPPDDSAPEVITYCSSSSGTDTAYDLATAAQLGNAPCGTSKPGEPALGNTYGPNLDYIPTPALASYEPVGVIETIPGTRYVSATGVGPELTSIDISGNTATMNFSVPVYCQDPGNSPQTAASFHLISPWWSTDPASFTYGSSIICPSATSPSTSIAVTFAQAIPTSGVAFKYDKYGSGYDIIGANGSALPGEAAVSQSAYQGPNPGAPTISSFTGPGTVPSSGGAATLDYATTNATQCTVNVTPSGTTTVEMPFAYLNQSNNPLAPLSNVAPCPAASATVLVNLPPNAGSQAVSYTFTLTANGPVGLNGGSSSKQVVVTVAGSPSGSTLPSSTTTSTLASTTTSTTTASTLPSTTTTTASTLPSTTTTTTASTLASTTTSTATSGPAGTFTVTSPTTANVAAATTTPGPVISPGPATMTRTIIPHVVRLTPARGSARGGVRVLVIGSGFTERVTVRFGSHHARHVRVLSSTRLIAWCPPGTGVQYVTVHTARGTSSPLRSARFLYRTLLPTGRP